MTEKIQITRKQHYVWRAYLKSWCGPQGIYCCRGSKIWNTKDLMRIGCEKDFYKLIDLSDKEIFLIKLIASLESDDPVLTDIINGWIQAYRNAYRIPAYLKDNKAISDIEYEKFITEAEELINCKGEEFGNNYLPKLQAGDIGFYKEIYEKVKFNVFICEQYFRTKKRLNAMAIIPNRGTGVDFKRIWPLLRHIFAQRVALFLSSNNFHLILLNNHTKNNFITGDQPVINRFATTEHQKILKPINDVELYYPITPKTAILLTDKKYKSDILNVNRVELVEELNDLIFANSEEQIYGIVENDIKKYKK